jgi:sialate O-acetylesterase
MYVKKIFLVVLFVVAKLALMADVTLPRIFGDNMVLQRGNPISIWGWAAKGEKLTIQFHQQKKQAKADKSGKWQVYLEPEMAGGPYQLSIKGKNLVTFENILVGEVWICSGQSNMEMPIAGWGKIDHFQEEIANASYPQIRQFKVPNTVSTSLKDDVTGGQWDICSPSTAGNFSATAYFFAREIYQRLKIPIGLINTSWGGTQSEAWTSKKAFEQSEYFEPIATAMNHGNVDSILQERKARVLKNIQRAQDGKYTGPANTNNWNSTSFDDSKWPEMKLPNVWEDQGLDGFDGEIWFRKTIAINKEDAGKPAILELAKIDDIDESYINGVRVGSIATWDELRKYNIAADILKEGKNIISVKVIDNGGGGGIYGEAADMKLTIGNQVVPLDENWKFQVAAISPSSSQGMGPNDYPSLLFNAMINPLLPYTIQGAIWYQGEANAGRAYEYRKEFPLMIEDWRKQWNKGNFPFIFVQLSTFGKADANSNTGSTWAELREAQAMTLSLPHTGMAVTLI